MLFQSTSFETHRPGSHPLRYTPSSPQAFELANQKIRQTHRPGFHSHRPATEIYQKTQARSHIGFLLTWTALAIACISLLPWDALSAPKQKKDQPVWSATFQFNQKMHSIRVSEKTAVILQESRQMIAECEVKHLDRDENQSPLWMDLACHSDAFNPLQTPVSIHWTSNEIRFGTWLSGYKKAKLQITLDRLSPRILALAQPRQ
jgi:hypothetical protein